ncbi:ABC transporter substrate-binding protein [Paenibacillus sp. GYB003]|uniref:ABC transporter substrate-binding protein n=1 Tax=Paenibacillus sp. GYB003 TaxID=2994392 RepID=UPI002F96460C
MLNRKVSAIAAGTALIALLSSCGGSSGGNAGDANPKEAGPAPSKIDTDKPLEIVFHTNSGDSEEAFNDLYGNALRKKFPNWTIRYVQSKAGQTLPELLAQGQQIDVLYASAPYFFQLVTNVNMQYDMTELAKTRQVDLTKFEPTLIDGIRSSGDGKLYGLPITNMNQVLFYNKGIFNQFGVPYPKDGMTWDDALELAKKVTRREGDRQYIGLAASPAHILGSNQLSKPYTDPVTDKPTFQDDAWKQLIRTLFLAPAEDEGYKARATELKRIPYRLELTNSQELAMFVFNSQFPFIVPKDMEKIEWDLVSLPTFKEKPKVGSQAAPVVMGVTSSAKNKEAAMEAIAYLTGADIQMSYSKKGIMPVIDEAAVKKAYGSESAFKDKNWQAVFYNEFAPMAKKSKYQLLVEGKLTPNIVDVVTGKTDLNTALRKSAEEAEKAIAEEKQK